MSRRHVGLLALPLSASGAVTCEDHVGSRAYIIAPKLVLEVISPKSVHQDRVDELDIYRAIPSVHEYLMVDARKVWASLNRRGPANTWLDIEFNSPNDNISLLSIELDLSLDQLYRGIDLSRKPKKIH
jgi:Uma2 family endonuclease